MRPVLLDLRGDSRWPELAAARRVVHVPLSECAFWSQRHEAPVLIDARGRHDDGVQLLARLPREEGRRRILLTDRESPLEHAAAYDAGATEIVVASSSEVDRSAILDDLVRGGD